MEVRERPVLNILGELVGLGPLRSGLPYHRWFGDFSTTRTVGKPLPMTEEQGRAWYDRHSSSEREVWFCIYELSTWRPIGTTGLLDLDLLHRKAEFSLLIGEPECRGKGYGTETTRLMLDYAYTALGLESVMLVVNEYNLAGRRAYQKAGFREFGRRRHARYMGGRFWAQVYMDCLATEFESPLLKRIFAPDEEQQGLE